MPAYFLDSSALVKAYRREAGTNRVTQLLSGSDPIMVARLAQVEVSSAIVRRGRAAGYSTRIFQIALTSNPRPLLPHCLRRAPFLHVDERSSCECRLW